MRIILLLFVFSIVFCSCNSEELSNDNTQIDFKRDSIGIFEYNIKDTISEIYISHQECTECLDAWIDSGQLFISETIRKKIQDKYNEKGSEFIPNGRDLYLIGEEKINEKLYGDSANFTDFVENRYVILGKAIDMKGWGIVFKVDSYKKLN